MDLDAAVRTQERDSAIFRGALATVLSRAGGAVIAVVVVAVATRSLDKAEFGLVATLVSIFVFLAFADLGVSGILMTRLAEAQARDDVEAMRHLIRTALVALTTFGCVVAIGGGASAFLLPWADWIGGGILPEHTVDVSVALLFVLSGAALPALVAEAILSAAQRLATVQVWFILGSVASLIGCLGAAAAHLPPWAYIVGIVGAPTAVTIGRALWLFLVEYPHLRPTRAAAAPGSLLDMMRASRYLAISRIAAAFFLGSHVFLVALIMGPAAAAVFSVASRMFALLTQVVQMVGGQMWPALTEAVTRGDIAWVRSRYRWGLLLVGGLTGLGCLVLVIAGQPLARLWVGPELVPPIGVLLTLAMLTSFAAVLGQAVLLPLAVERIKGFAIVMVASTPVSIALAVVLTRELGMVGPALGGLLTYALLIGPFALILCRRTLTSITSTSASLPR